jgi:hypothetical protein
MSASRSRGLVAAILLLVPLAAAAAILVYGGRIRVFGPREASVSTLAAGGGGAGALLDGLAERTADLPPERFHEQVNGAAEFLISIGATRIVAWRVAGPPEAFLELLEFRDEAGARRALEQDAGGDRTPGPGDEAWTGADSVMFRRGRRYVRLNAPGATGAGAAERLAELAARTDERLRGAGAAGGAP